MKKLITSLLGLLLLLLAAPLRAQEAGINNEVLNNLSYPDNFSNPPRSITLTDGFYEENIGGIVSRYQLSPARAFGDFNGDGLEDAVVLMYINTGGTGSFLHAIPVRNDGMTLSPLQPLFLGDRWFAHHLTISNGEVSMIMQRGGPSDPLCCPSEVALMRFQLVGNQLNLVEDRVLWNNSSVDALPPGVSQSSWDFALLDSGFTAPSLRFAPGTTSATLLGHVGARELDFLNFGAGAGQFSTVQVASLTNDVQLQLLDRSTGLLVTGPTLQWSGPLPSTGDYMLRVHSSSEAGAFYLLWVSILP